MILNIIPKELTIIGAVFLMLMMLAPVLFLSNNLMAFSAKTTLVGGFGFGSMAQ
jgi:hypothetical protein